MISISVKLSPSNVGGLGVNSQSLFRKVQMEKLGNFAIATVKARVAKGVGSDDAAMKPLSGKTSPILHRGKFVRQRQGYAAWKSQHGLQPIRDLKGIGKDGGHMLDNISVRSVSESTVRISLTQNKARAKALANEKRTPWFSFSPDDERLIVDLARQLFHSEVEVIRRQHFVGSARTGQYMDTLSLPALSLAA